MSAKRVFGVIVLVSGLMAMLGADVWAGMATPATIIVMPARRRVVELVGQIARLKDVGLVSYNAAPNMNAPLIHIWNGMEWIQIAMDDYVAGSFMSGEPKHLIVIGDSATVPERMAVNPTWCRDVQRIPSLATATLLNDMDKTLHFTPRQWEWLARENGLALTDQNAERRRYGRWGPPGSEANAAPKAPFKATEGVTMPPTVIVVPASKEDLKPAAKPETTPEVKATPVTEQAPEVKAENPVEVSPAAPAAPVTPVEAAAKAADAPSPSAEKPADPVVAPPVTP